MTLHLGIPLPCCMELPLLLLLLLLLFWGVLDAAGALVAEVTPPDLRLTSTENSQ